MRRMPSVLHSTPLGPASVGSISFCVSAHAQAGGKNETRDVKTPAGLTRLFKSALDWNLYSSLQHEANDRKVRRCCAGLPSSACAYSHVFIAMWSMSPGGLEGG